MPFHSFNPACWKVIVNDQPDGVLLVQLSGNFLATICWNSLEGICSLSYGWLLEHSKSKSREANIMRMANPWWEWANPCWSSQIRNPNKGASWQIMLLALLANSKCKSDVNGDPRKYVWMKQDAPEARSSRRWWKFQPAMWWGLLTRWGKQRQKEGVHKQLEWLLLCSSDILHNTCKELILRSGFALA